MNLALISSIGLTKARILIKAGLSFLIMITIRIIIIINYSSYKYKFSSVSFPENGSNSRSPAVEKAIRHLGIIRIVSQTPIIIVILSGRLIAISGISSDRSPVLISTLL